MDGFAVCRAIRHVERRVPIVFVTAKGDLRDYAAGREAGGDSYLVKPIARAALRSIVALFTTVERNGGGGGPAGDRVILGRPTRPGHVVCSTARRRPREALAKAASWRGPPRHVPRAPALASCSP